MDSLFRPKEIDYYKSLTSGGEVNLNLSQEEACVALKIYDYGVDALKEADKEVLYRMIGKLKDQIWP